MRNYFIFLSSFFFWQVMTPRNLVVTQFIKWFNGRVEIIQGLLPVSTCFLQFRIGALESLSFANHICGAQSGYYKINMGKRLESEAVLLSFKEGWLCQKIGLIPKCYFLMQQFSYLFGKTEQNQIQVSRYFIYCDEITSHPQLLCAQMGSIFSSPGLYQLPVVFARNYHNFGGIKNFLKISLKLGRPEFQKSRCHHG